MNKIKIFVNHVIYFFINVIINQYNFKQTMETTDSNNQNEIEQSDEINNNESAIVCKTNENHKLKLESINLECFLLILDNLDSASLMELCQVNGQSRSNVLSYKHILSSKLFKIDEFVDVSCTLFLRFNQVRFEYKREF